MVVRSGLPDFTLSTDFHIKQVLKMGCPFATGKVHFHLFSIIQVCYHLGEGVREDKERAVEWYRKAAEQGYAPAQYNLGVCYDLGEGVREDKERAVEWYRKAAEQGHAVAQNWLGFCYQHGEGVREDKERAVEWYRKAAEQGYAPAQEVLDEIK